MRQLPVLLVALVLLLGLSAPLFLSAAEGAAEEPPPFAEESLRSQALPATDPRALVLPPEAPRGTPGRPVLEVHASLIDESIFRKHLHFQDALSAP